MNKKIHIAPQDGDYIPFEEILSDGTKRSGIIRLLGLEASQEELELLRDIAFAADNFQQISKYVAGDFTRLYQALQKWREFRQRIRKE